MFFENNGSANPLFTGKGAKPFDDRKFYRIETDTFIEPVLPEQ